MIVAFLTWIVFGLIIGAIARAIIPGRQEMGVGTTALLGVAGSMAGGLLAWFLTGGVNDPYQPAGWVMSIVGAVLVLWVALAAGGKPRNI